MIAFQLTYPFETDIPLTDANAAAGSTTGATDPRDSDYYSEFAGRYFKLADFDPASQMLKPVVLNAGETRTFYIAGAGGGLVLEGGVTVVTPTSPMGRALLGKGEDDECELVTGGTQRTLVITAVA